MANTDWYLYNFRLSLVRYLQARGMKVFVASPPGPYAERLIAEGVAWLMMRLNRRSLNPVSQIETIASLRRRYAQIKPDLVHHFTIKCAVHGSLAAKLSNVRGIVNAIVGLGSTTHAPSRRWLASTLARNSLRIALRGTQVIVQNSDDHAFLTNRRIVDATACTLIRGSGVNTERFTPHKKAGNDITVVMASRLLWSKGIAEFVRAAEYLHRRHPNLRCVIAGSPDPGNPDSLVESDLQSLRSHKAVVFAGHIEDVSATLQAADVAVLPSYGEGVPKSLVEAAACGLPLVATDVSGCREIVRHGVNGLLVPVADPCALAQAVEALVRNPALRERMGAESRAIAVAEFAEDIVHACTLDVYRRAMGRKSGEQRRLAMRTSARRAAQNGPI